MFEQFFTNLTLNELRVLLHKVFRNKIKSVHLKEILKKIGEKNFLLLLNHLLVTKKKPFFSSFDDAMTQIVEVGVCGILVREGIARDEEDAKKIFFEKEKVFFF